MNSDSSVKTVRCNGCGEWYDARAGSCYLCGVERPDHNAALAAAVHETRLNSALNIQAGAARAEAQASSMVAAGTFDHRRGGHGGTQAVYPGARGLEQSIRKQITESGMLA